MRVLKNRKIVSGQGVIEHGFIRYDRQIAQVGTMDEYQQADTDEVVETAADTVIPGFIDIHSHGGYGYDSMDATAEEICGMVRQMTAKEGITSYFCTTMTQSTDKISQAMEEIREAAKQNPVIQGIHLEGPFVSALYKGAQDASYIRQPDARLLNEWNQKSGGRIRIVTYAPEEASAEFEDWCVSRGIVLSAGHSNAQYDCLCESRATHVTHLYNAQRGLNHREPGVTGYGLLGENVFAELICDGIHIRPEMISLACKVRGYDRIILITDSMRAKGMPDGGSELGGQTVYVKDGMAQLEDGTIAGSVLRYIDAFHNVMHFTGASLEDAVKMTSCNQAREFGLTQKGEISAGKDADFVLLGEQYELKGTVSMGELFLP